MARTQATGNQIRDSSIQSIDLEDRSVTDQKLTTTGVVQGTYTKLSVTSTGRISSATNAILGDLENINFTSLSAGQALIFDGLNWVNGSNTGVLFIENPVGGIPSTAAGDNSVAIGQGAYAVAGNSVAIGNQSIGRFPGITQANGRFASQGDAQTGKYLLRTSTINGNPTELFLDGTNGTQQLILPSDSTWLFDITIIGHRTDSGDGHAGFKFSGVIYKVGSVNTFIMGSISKEILSAPSGWNAAVEADNVNGSLKLTVTGQAGKTIRWFATVQTTEVTN